MYLSTHKIVFKIQLLAQRTEHFEKELAAANLTIQQKEAEIEVILFEDITNILFIQMEKFHYLSHGKRSNLTGKQ